MEPLDLTRLLAAFVFVIGLLALASWAIRRFDLGRRLAGGVTGGRLTVAETRWLDSRSRLIVVRFGEREHLVLLASGNAVHLATEPARSEGNGA